MSPQLAIHSVSARLVHGEKDLKSKLTVTSIFRANNNNNPADAHFEDLEMEFYLHIYLARIAKFIVPNQLQFYNISMKICNIGHTWTLFIGKSLIKQPYFMLFSLQKLKQYACFF